MEPVYSNLLTRAQRGIARQRGLLVGWWWCRMQTGEHVRATTADRRAGWESGCGRTVRRVGADRRASVLAIDREGGGWGWRIARLRIMCYVQDYADDGDCHHHGVLMARPGLSHLRVRSGADEVGRRGSGSKHSQSAWSVVLVDRDRQVGHKQDGHHRGHGTSSTRDGAGS